MSREKACIGTKVLGMNAEDILDAWVAGGVDLNSAKREQPISIDKRNIEYSFATEEGFSVQARLYWIMEDGRPRQYLWIECACSKLQGPRAEVMGFLLEKSQQIPQAYKLCMYDGLVILCARGPVDGYALTYLRDLVDGLVACTVHVFTEAHEMFGVPTLADAVRAEKNQRLQ